MRRISVTAFSIGVLLLVGGYFALGAAGNDPRPAVAQTGAPMVSTTPTATAAADLPPLPTDSRARAVQPVAGEATAQASDETAPDPGLTDAGAAPTHAASSLKGDHPASGGNNSVTKAVAVGNGVALPPLEAPDEIKEMIEAGNGIARTPYIWGGGHGKWLDHGYDCSGSVSFMLASAGLLSAPETSGQLMSFGKAGPGKWITIYASPTHVFLEVAGIRFDTGAQRVTGSRWAPDGRSTAGFVARHPDGL
jgi:hypothetical protein